MILIPRSKKPPEALRGFSAAYLSQSNPPKRYSPEHLRGIRFTAQQSQKANPPNPRLLHRLRGIGIPTAHEGVGGHR